MNRDRGFRREQRERIIDHRIDDIKAHEENGIYGLKADSVTKGKLVKKHPFDCGKADCQNCHGEKVKPKGHGKRKQKIRRLIEEELEARADDEIDEIY